MSEFDRPYFEKKLQLILRDLSQYTAEEISLELYRLSNTAVPNSKATQLESSLAAEQESRKKLERENELYRAEMSEAKEAGFYSASELFSAYKISEQRAEAAEAIIKASRQQANYKCFHCGETFDDDKRAREHFGTQQTSLPACQIGGGAVLSILESLRDAEEQLARYYQEDSEVCRSMHAMATKHAAQLRSAEELGYERGLKDAQHPIPSDVSELQRQLEEAKRVPSFADFNIWMQREIPSGTIIGDAGWWAARIYKRFIAKE